MFKLAVTSALVACANAGVANIAAGNGQRQGYVHSIDGVPTVPHYALNRWADYQIERKLQVLNPTGRIVPRVLSNDGSPGGDDVVFTVSGTNLADHTANGQSVTTNPARFELRVCVHHNSRNPFGLYSVTPSLPCTCESPIIGAWNNGSPAVSTCPVNTFNVNGVCTYTALSADVASTAADPTTGTISFDSGAIDAMMRKGAPIPDSRVPLEGINPGTIPDGIEVDAILCGFTEPRRHLYDVYHPNDGLASVRVPFTDDGSPSGTTNAGTTSGAAASGAAAVGDVLSTYLVRFRRACSSSAECVDRANDSDSDNGADRRSVLDRLRGTLSTTCSASLGVCQVPEVEKRCGRSLYDFRSQKCCSDDEAAGKIVYPRGTASFRSVNDVSDLLLADDADLGELLLDVGAVEEFPCPCTGDDGVDDLADFSGNTFDLGATVGCEKAGQKCCPFRQLLDVYQTQSPNVVGTQGAAATRRAVEINPDLGMVLVPQDRTRFNDPTLPPTAVNSLIPLVDLDEYTTSITKKSPFSDLPVTQANFVAISVLPVADINPGYSTPFLPASSTEAAGWGPDAVGKARASEFQFGAVDVYPRGSAAFPYYFCYDAAIQQCCDDGQVYNPQSHQCCPIGNVVPVEQPCVCSADSHCVRPELDDTDPAYGARKCCMQTSPPSEALEEHMAFCNRYASVNLRFDEVARSLLDCNPGDPACASRGDATYTNSRFASGIQSVASARYMGRTHHVGRGDLHSDLTPASEYRFDIPAGLAGQFPTDGNQNFGPLNARGTNNQFSNPFPAGPNTRLASDDPVVNGYDRLVATCPGTCIDPSYQLCCNGATCRGEYERCCNTTCCNKFSATCVKGKKPANEGFNFRGILDARQSPDRSDDQFVWQEDDDQENIFSVPNLVRKDLDSDGEFPYYTTLDSLFRRYGNQQAAGVNTFWSDRNFRLEYDVCTAVEYLDPVRAFWVFVLPTFLLLTSVVGLFATVTFLLRIRTGYSPRYSGGETALVSVAFLELVFALFLFFSPQWKYGVIAVLTALYAMFAVGIRSRTAYAIMVAAQLVLVVYLVDPFGANLYFNLNEQRSVSYDVDNGQNGLTYYGSATRNLATSGLWRAISNNWPALNHRDTPNLFGRAPSQKTPDDVYNNFFGATFKTVGQGPGFRESYCTTYYNYFQLDARLLDFKIDNPAEAFFGYCSRTWTVVLLVMSGFVVLLALTLLALAVIGAVQQMLEDQDVSLASDPEHFVDAQKVDSDLQPYFTQQELDQ